MDKEFWFLIQVTTVTLYEGQGHPNWYQNVKLCGLYRATIEGNWALNVWKQANDKGVGFLFKNEIK